MIPHRIIIGKDSSITYDFPVGKSESTVCWGPKFVNVGKTLLVNSAWAERLVPIHCKSKRAAKELFEKFSGVDTETLPDFKNRPIPCSCRRPKSGRVRKDVFSVLNFRDHKITRHYEVCSRCWGYIPLGGLEDD